MMQNRAILADICQLILGVVFVYASIGHVENSYSFLSSVYSYSMVSREFGIMVATVVPGLELALGLTFLLDSRQRHASFVVAGFLLCLFSISQIVAYSRGLNISCGCFGKADDNPIGPFSIGRTVLFTMIAVIGCCCSLKRTSRSDNTITRRNDS